MRRYGFILFQDRAGMWCAAPPGFRDLVIDPAGWGKTREAAVQRLLANAEYRRRARLTGWAPALRDFMIVAEPNPARKKGRGAAPPDTPSAEITSLVPPARQGRPASGDRTE
jgi:hypothetical protein